MLKFWSYVEQSTFTTKLFINLCKDVLIDFTNVLTTCKHVQ